MANAPQPMKFALYGLHRGSSVDPDVLRARAARAEEAGFEGLWVGDHVALPLTAPDPADEPRLEALTALTWLAAATRTIGLGVGVLVLPQRQPVLLAKQLASLDLLSGGRLTVGVAAGYVGAELRALGVAPEHRGAMTDEHIEAVRTLWVGGPQTFAGRWAAFAEVQQSPAPVQRPGQDRPGQDPRPGPPIVVGGHAPAALRRAGTVGDGWFGWGLGPEEAAVAVAEVRRVAAEAGREPERLEITITPPAPLTVEAARRYAAVGVDRLVLLPDRFDGDEIDRLVEDAAARLIGHVER
jgi:probable F420-dependent oxidoreductase